MKRLLALGLALVFMAAGLGASVPETLTLAPPADGWADSYISFLDESFDTFASLWPEGMGGIAFIDLDLDGTPEMVVFDQGASAAMGVHLFDLADGSVRCVSSALDGAQSAFGGGSWSSVYVNAGFFESFRLSRTDAGWCFWIDSSNGTMESAWDEIVRFDDDGGVLTPVSVCDRYLEFDLYSGQAVTERYRVSGVTADAAGYDQAAAVYQAGLDTGYEAKGVYMWDSASYGASREGLLAMARDAASVYVPITSTVTLASISG